MHAMYSVCVCVHLSMGRKLEQPLAFILQDTHVLSDAVRNAED